MTFHLSRLLGLDNVPLMQAVVVNLTDTRWRDVAEAIVEAGWNNGDIVTLSQWIHDLAQTRLQVFGQVTFSFIVYRKSKLILECHYLF